MMLCAIQTDGFRFSKVEVGCPTDVSHETYRRHHIIHRRRTVRLKNSKMTAAMVRLLFVSCWCIVGGSIGRMALAFVSPSGTNFRRHHRCLRSVPPPKTDFWSNSVFGKAVSVLPEFLKSQKSDPNSGRRDEIKAQLLDVCCSSDNSRTASENRQEIEKLMDLLRPLSPVTDTATSPLLLRNWELIWTTEKEINWFLDTGFSNYITQTIDENQKLTNQIYFKKGGGSFGVVGKLENDEDSSIRTNFVFEEATLDLKRWGIYKFPPVGKGWFDTIYLDNTLRIDRNSRNDILICRPVATARPSRNN